LRLGWRENPNLIKWHGVPYLKLATLQQQIVIRGLNRILRALGGFVNLYMATGDAVYTMGGLKGM